MGKIAALQAVDQGSTPCGVTARSSNREDTGLISRQCGFESRLRYQSPVVQRQNVRLLTGRSRFESWPGSHGGIAQQVRALLRQSRGREFETRRHRQACIAQRHSARTTTWRGAFGSCRGYHAPVAERRSCRITDPAVGVRVPPLARTSPWRSRIARPPPKRQVARSSRAGDTKDRCSRLWTVPAATRRASGCRAR